jgi:hypothetical protein
MFGLVMFRNMAEEISKAIDILNGQRRTKKGLDVRFQVGGIACANKDCGDGLM